MTRSNHPNGSSEPVGERFLVQPATNADLTPFRAFAESVGAEGGDVVVELGIDRADLVQAQVHVLFGIAAGTGLVDGDGVRTADAQATGVVATACIGDGAADRARLDVGDGDFSAGNGLAVCTDDLAADAGGGALRENGSRGKRDHQAQRQLRQPDAIRVSHIDNLK